MAPSDGAGDSRGGAVTAPNAAPGAIDKQASTMQAVAALAGVRVDPIEGDDGRTVYIVSRWALTKQCNTLDELRVLLQRMGIAA